MNLTGENCEETNSDDHAWRCRYARHSYRVIRETDKQRGLRLRRLSRLMLRIADIALIVVKTAKPPDHCDLVALRPAKFLLEIPRRQFLDRPCPNGPEEARQLAQRKMLSRTVVDTDQSHLRPMHLWLLGSSE